METAKLLILGGTGEAAALARAAGATFGMCLHVTSSLAGRTRNPAALPGLTREGGFGGAAGLARYLADQGVHMVIDATHPFAATISAHGREACDQAGIPRLQLIRPRWRRQKGDHWILVDDAAAAARALADHGGRALVTIGVKELGPFANLKGQRCLVRLIAGFAAMGRDGSGEGVGRVDHHMDALIGEISRQPRRAAEAALPHRTGKGGGMARAPGEGTDHMEAHAESRHRRAGQGGGLAGTAEDQEFSHGR